MIAMREAGELESDVPVHMVRRTIRRRWTMILAVTVLITGLGVAYVVARPPSFTSSVEVLLLPIVGNPFSADSLATSQQLTVGLETEAKLINSPQVTAEVVKRVGSDVAEGRVSVSASVVLSTQIINIEFSAPSRDAAQAGAQAYAEGFLAVRKAQATAVRDDEVTRFDARITTTQAALEKAAEQAVSTHPPAGAAAQVQLLATRLASLQQKLGDAQSTATTPGAVVVPATAPGRAQLVKSVLLAGAAGILGLVLGFSLALWRTWADDRIDSRDEFFVAGIALWAALGSTAEQRLFSDETDETVREAYRRLRTTVAINTVRPSILAIASSEILADLAGVATNLAVCLADAGFNVTLVDAAVEGPGVADVLGVSSGSGVSDILTSGVGFEDVTLHEHGVRVLLAGSDPRRAQDLYAGDRFAEMLVTLRGASEYVITLASPLSTSSGLAAASAADGVVLVAVEGVTTHEEVADLIERSRAQEVEILGIVTVAHDRDELGTRTESAPATRHEQDGGNTPRPIDHVHARHCAPAEFDSEAVPSRDR